MRAHERAARSRGRVVVFGQVLVGPFDVIHGGLLFPKIQLA
jgi:hypothetical protein